MQDHRVKVDKVELQVQEFEQKGEAIIFLHFSGANLMMWQGVIPFFQSQYHLILVDLRGHGKSDKPETGYRIDEMARDVVGVMQHLKLERAHIVGSSLGAEVGLSLAANYPEKVISLVCDGASSSECGPYGLWEGSETEFEEHVTNQLEKIRSTPETVYSSVEELVNAMQEILEKLGWWNPAVEAMEKYGAYKVGEGKYLRGMAKRAKEIYMQDYFHCRFEDYYRRVECPLMMLAEKDLEDEREIAALQGLRKLASQGEIVEVSRWVHPYGWLLNPENASIAILKFIAKTTH